MRSECVCCGKQITWRFYLCAECEAQHTKPYPVWLQFLLNDAMKHRKRIERGREDMLSFEEELGGISAFD
jgi:hypothetical protein